MVKQPSRMFDGCLDRSRCLFHRCAIKQSLAAWPRASDMQLWDCSARRKAKSLIRRHVKPCADTFQQMASFERHARTVTLLTGISRVTGLARDAALSRVFGAGPIMDAFFFAFLIPNLFRRLFGEGALSAAFLPVYAKLRRDDPAAAQQLAALTISILVFGLGALTLLGELLLFVLSAQAQHSNVALWLMMVMLPYMPMVCIVAVLGAMQT